MRRFLMDREEERFGGIALSQPIQRHVRGEVGHITGVLFAAVLGDEHRIEILPLSRQNPPVGVVGDGSIQMPFADHRRLIACFA